MVAIVLLGALLLGGSPDQQATNVDQALKSLPPEMRNREDLKDAAEMATMQKPKGCKDKCDVVDTMMKKTCSHSHDGKKPPPTAVKKCEGNSKQMVDACQASCRDKGKIDKEYIKSQIKMPSAAQRAAADRDDHE